MRVIISPAKKMRRLDDSLAPLGLPALLDRARELHAWLRGLSFEEAKRLWGCSDRLARACYEELQATDPQLEALTTPAVLSYDGIAFTYMAPSVFDVDELAYVQDHLRILSGFYGALRPMDAVVPYRLEMQAKAHVAGARDLYGYWGDAIYREVMRGNGDRVVVNLASKEYSRCVSRYLEPEDTFVTCTFAEETADGRLVQKGVYCKMARGEMVRWMAAHDVRGAAELAGFDSPDWRFAPERSSADGGELVFLRRAGERG